MQAARPGLVLVWSDPFEDRLDLRVAGAVAGVVTWCADQAGAGGLCGQWRVVGRQRITRQRTGFRAPTWTGEPATRVLRPR